jgi:hypothetical protein
MAFWATTLLMFIAHGIYVLVNYEKITDAASPRGIENDYWTDTERDGGASWPGATNGSGN